MEKILSLDYFAQALEASEKVSQFYLRRHQIKKLLVHSILLHFPIFICKGKSFSTRKSIFLVVIHNRYKKHSVLSSQ